MGNQANLEQWAAMERMRFIERSAYWRGVVNRQDLTAVFGLSLAQASADLQAYQQANPGALNYNLNKKRYEGARDMKLAFTQATLEDAMAMFLRGGAEAPRVAMVPAGRSAAGSGSAQVYFVRVPVRRPGAEVERRVFLAVYGRMRVRVLYRSVNSGKAEWRWLQPSAFAHDGNRWHVRAWCELRQRWSDFTLSRIEAAEWPVAGPLSEVPDRQRAELMELAVKAAESLNEGARKAVEMDFGMVRGKLAIPTTAAEIDYLRTRLGLPLGDGKKPPQLVEELGAKAASRRRTDGAGERS